MSADGCRRWRALIGSFVLGHLAEPMHARLGAHLDACALCRAEAEALAEVAAVLPHADPARLEATAPAPSGLEERVLREVARARSGRRRRSGAVWIARTVGAIAAAVLIAVAAVSLVGREDAERVTFAGAPPGVQASARVAASPWGMRIELRASGLEPGTVLAVWCEQLDGVSAPAGSFRARADGTVSAVLGTGVSYRQWSAIRVVSLDGSTVMQARANDVTER